MKSVVWGRNSTLILNNLCLNFLYYCLENGRKDHYKSSFIEHFCLVALRNTEGMRKIIDLVFLPWGATFNRHWWTCKQNYNAVSSVQSLSRVLPFATPWTAARQASVHHQLPEHTQTQVHWVGDAIQPSHPLLSLSPPALNLSQHQGLFQWVSSSHQVAKVLEFQLQRQSFQWTPRTDFL